MKNNKSDTVAKSYLKFVSSMKSFDDDTLTIRGVIGSDDSLDRHGDRINPKGWQLDNYKKNPVILLNHAYHDLPIAKAVNVKRSGGGLVFEIQFSKSYDKSVIAYNLAKEGILNAWSVGFIILKWGEAGKEYSIDEAELLELSLVTVPANPNALTPRQLKDMGELGINIKAEEENTETDPVDEPVVPEEEPETPQEPVVEDKSEENKDETDTEPEAKEEPEVKEESAIKQNLFDFKTLEKDEAFVKFISGIIEQEVKKYFEVKDVKADEEEVENLTLLALNAMRQELQKQNKESGKTLQAFNTFINSQKKEA